MLVGFRPLELLFTLWNGINWLLPVHWEGWRCSQSALMAWKNCGDKYSVCLCEGIGRDVNEQNHSRPYCLPKKCCCKDAGMDTISPWIGSSEGPCSVVPMHNLNQAPRVTIRQTGAAESGKASISASRIAACHVVPCGLQNRLDKSEAFQNPQYLQEQAHCPIWQYFFLLEILVLKNLS